MSDQKKDNVKSQNRWCGSCGEELALDHSGIRCKQSHHLCTDCSQNFKKSVFDIGPAAFPPKCSFCACHVDVLSFERQLNGTDEIGERGQYLTYMMMHQLEDGEVLSNCPFCPFFCTRFGEAAQLNFVHCQRPDCGKVSCSLCCKECVPVDDDSEEDESVRLGMAEHFACACALIPASNCSPALLAPVRTWTLCELSLSPLLMR